MTQLNLQSRCITCYERENLQLRFKIALQNFYDMTGEKLKKVIKQCKSIKKLLTKINLNLSWKVEISVAVSRSEVRAKGNS